MNIRTNNHARPLLGFYDLSEKERTEVGSAYDIVGAQFVRYREWVYAMDDFRRNNSTRVRRVAWSLSRQLLLGRVNTSV
jgi:hypothetical protein